ncbi:hypothetical protein [Leptolyngbya sp. AN10]|uniref:hypothetical protein n=1 Tax=Leptolyngbya sp. AN10 TaxID=3423365 RepID=UPI003D321722
MPQETQTSLPRICFPPLPTKPLLTEQQTQNLTSKSIQDWEALRQDWYRENWGEFFSSQISLDSAIHLLDPLLGRLKAGKPSKAGGWSRDHLLGIHRLEKDLIYLIAKAINCRAQLFLSLPVSPVSLGILTVAYYASLAREERDPFSTNQAISAKNFVIWIRPHDNGQIQNLKITRSSSEPESLRDRMICLPIQQFDESAKEQRLRIYTARSLSDAIALLRQSNFCSLVVLDDSSGRTYPSPSSYGNEAYKLADLCKQAGIPMIGVVPPWTMRILDFWENKSNRGMLLWAVDFAALQSYPTESSPFSLSSIPHPIEESYQTLDRKCKSLSEAQVTIKTFSFDTEDEAEIADAFEQISDLLMDLARQPELRGVWSKGWAIWRELLAPILPMQLMWEQFLQQSLRQLQAAAERCADPKALDLYQYLRSLTLRLQKLSRNPFIEAIESFGNETIVAVSDTASAEALEKFLAERCERRPRVTTLNELKGQGGDRLIVVGQPKARYRNLLQTTFFRQVDVLLWSVLAERAEHWWSGLEIDSRAWHIKTWKSLTGQDFYGRYGYSYRPNLVQVIHLGKTKLSKSVDLSKLEEKFGEVSDRSLDSGLVHPSSNQIDSHYQVEFEKNFRIRVSPNSEFLILVGSRAQAASVKELCVNTKVILFEGMNRDELFAQKAGLLEESRENWLYQVQLEGWRVAIKQRVEQLNSSSVCRQIFQDTGITISEQTIQRWMAGDDLLSLPRDSGHFFWFLPTSAHAHYEPFWQTANKLRGKRRHLGQVISACAEAGWKDRDPTEIVFQYKQVFITVGELRDAMQVLKVQAVPRFLAQKPDYPFNRLFRVSKGSH